LNPLSELIKSYDINPITDLVPVCPNCHAMTHRSAEPLSVTKLKEMLKSVARACAQASTHSEKAQGPAI
jgi:predicted HNH restriction endonuclease